MHENIQEYTNTPRRDIRIDSEAGILYGVKIIGSKSRNGREYPDKTLREAISLYENAKVNLDHPDGDPGKPRSYQDRFGAIHNVRLKENEGLFADFRFNPKHAVAEQLLWDAKHAPENVGFSHNVEATVRREQDRTIVEKILKVRSVDLVADPASTAGLFESVEKEVEMSRRREDPSELETPRNTVNENASNRSGRNFLSLLCENLLNRFKEILPETQSLFDADFLETLRLTQDPVLQGRLIEDRMKLLERLSRVQEISVQKPISREQTVPEKPIDTKSFVKLLRR